MSILKTVSPQVSERERLLDLEKQIAAIKARKAALEKEMERARYHILVQETDFTVSGRTYPMLQFVSCKDGVVPEKLTKWNTTNLSVKKVRLVLENPEAAWAFVNKNSGRESDDQE